MVPSLSSLDACWISAFFRRGGSLRKAPQKGHNPEGTRTIPYFGREGRGGPWMVRSLYLQPGSSVEASWGMGSCQGSCANKAFKPRSCQGSLSDRFCHMPWVLAEIVTLRSCPGSLSDRSCQVPTHHPVLGVGETEGTEEPKNFKRNLRLRHPLRGGRRRGRTLSQVFSGPLFAPPPQTSPKTVTPLRVFLQSPDTSCDAGHAHAPIHSMRCMHWGGVAGHRRWMIPPPGPCPRPGPGRAPSAPHRP